MSIQAANEEWRPVVGFEGLYLVSNWGRVRRLPLSVIKIINDHKTIRKFYKGRILMQHKDKDGYLRVSLRRTKQAKTMLVHRLVATAFIGTIPPGMWVLHGPKGNQCNTVDNVYIGTPKQNALDKIRDNTVARDEKNGRSKLTIAEVALIKKKLNKGKSVSKLAKQYKVSRKAIYLIKTGINWRELDSSGPRVVHLSAQNRVEHVHD